jgi:hypothetical protein
LNYFITSIPKSGTHLLASFVNAVAGEYPTSVKKEHDRKFDYGRYARAANLVGHIRARQISENSSLASLFASRRVLVLVRDPRAICNSMLHFLGSSHHDYHAKALQRIEHFPFDERIMSIAKGLVAEDGRFMVPELTKMCSGFVELTKMHPDAHLLRYEDFFDVDSMGDRLAGIFEIDRTHARACLSTALSGGSRTKREGDPNGWRAAYSPKLRRHFKDNYGAVLASLGYEP